MNKWILRNRSGVLIGQFDFLQDAIDYANKNQVQGGTIDGPMSEIEQLEEMFRELGQDLFSFVPAPSDSVH